MSVQISPDDPRLDEVILTGNFSHTRAVARHMFWNDPKASWRVETCGRRSKLRKCDVRHLSKRVLLCERRFACKNCAKEYAMELVDRYAKNCEVLRNRRERATFLEIVLDCDRRDIESMRAFQTNMAESLRRLIGNAALWTYAIGFEGDTAVLRVLFQNPRITRQQIESTIGLARIRVMEQSHNIFALLRDRLLQVWLPSDPLDQAEHEKLFQGYHRIRASNMPQKISVMDSTSQTYTEKSGPHAHRKPEKCPICSGKIVAESESYPIDATPEQLRNLRWYPVDS